MTIACTDGNPLTILDLSHTVMAIATKCTGQTSSPESEVRRVGILVADEPVSALDVSVRAQVLNLITDLVKDPSLTLVFVSHDLSVVSAVPNLRRALAGTSAAEPAAATAGTTPTKPILAGTAPGEHR